MPSLNLSALFLTHPPSFSSPIFLLTAALTFLSGFSAYITYFFSASERAKTRRNLALTFFIPVTVTAIQIHILDVHCTQANPNTIALMGVFATGMVGGWVWEKSGGGGKGG